MTLQQAGIQDADLLVAVTDVDEVNLVASMLAERVGKSSEETVTIARVRSDEFTGDRSALSLRDFGIDHIIHPEQSTANEVVSLLRRAAATDVVEFCGDRVQLVGIRIDRDCPGGREVAHRDRPAEPAAVPHHGHLARRADDRALGQGDRPGQRPGVRAGRERRGGPGGQACWARRPGGCATS